MARVNRTAVLGFLLISTLGCAGTPAAFSARYPDNVEGDLKLLLQRTAAAPPRTTLPIAAGVSANKQLYAYDLSSRRTLWQVPARPAFAPQLAGNAVVIQEGDRIVGFDARNGAPRFQFDVKGMHLVGADGEGDRVVVALTSGQGTFARSRLAFVSGATRAWTRDLNYPVGVPALAGSVVLVPWSNQYLSGIDATSGEEFARLRVREAVISHALVSGGHVFAGSQHGLAALTPDIVTANLKHGPYYDAPKEDLPGRPQFLRDAYTPTPLPEPESAQNRIRLAWQPELSGGSKVDLAGGNLYLTFYRFVFALDPHTLGLHWVYTHDVDLVGARAQKDGLLIADVRGEIRYLAANSGATLWVEKNAPPSLALELPPDQSAVGANAGRAAQSPDMRKQLAAAAQDPDSRLVPVRLLAVQLLAKLSDPAATQDLLVLCEDDRTTVGIRKAACNALRQRTAGNDYVLTALARHAVFLDGTEAPPVGALARAAATQKETRAVPLLLSHLDDPNTPSPGLAEVVRALGDLRDPSAAGALAKFLLLYHADAIDEHVAHALEFVPETLVKLLGQGARPTLERVTADPLTVSSVADRAQKALAQLDEQAKAGEKDPAAEQLAAQRAQEETAKPEPPAAPAHITVDVIKQALLPVHDRLKACIADAKPDTFQARVVLVVEDGQVLMVSVLPEHLQNCIEPLVRSQPFPLTTTSQRERVTYVIKRN